MKFTDLNHLKAVKFLSNLYVVEKSLHKELELGKIDESKFTSMLRGLAEQRRNLYKAIEAMPELHCVPEKNNFNKFPPINEA